MDAFELLKADHKKVSQLFAQIEKASGGASKKRIFRQLKSELDVHARAEEEIFYPALQNKEESRDITLEAYEEHKVVKDLLAELEAQAHSDEWDAKLTVLKENVEHHVEEEEGELFDKAEKALSAEQIDRLGAEMEAEKASLQPGANGKRKTVTSKKSIKASAPARKPTGGVLERLAGFIGLGGGASNPAKAVTKQEARKNPPKTTKSKVASKTKKAAKKSPAKASSKTRAKKAVKGMPRRRTAAKTATKIAKQK